MLDDERRRTRNHAGLRPLEGLRSRIASWGCSQTFGACMGHAVIPVRLLPMPSYPELQTQEQALVPALYFGPAADKR